MSKKCIISCSLQTGRRIGAFFFEEVNKKDNGEYYTEIIEGILWCQLEKISTDYC